MKKIVSSLSILGLLSTLHAYSGQSPEPIKLSFFLTNDVHGHIENMALMGGFVKELRDREEYKSGKAGLLVLDSGDQFQGTLISDYDEGKTVFKIFNEIGYDAIIPGNHDYDLGPGSFSFDHVKPVTSQNLRDVILDLSGIAQFPMLSANTYLRKTIKMTGTQTTVDVDDSCVPKNQSLASPLDFAHAQRPAFLKPYTIVEKAGVRVALIGIDNRMTTSTTTSAYVSDLCFRDEAETFIEMRKSLEGQADVFVILVHNGNVAPSTFTASDIVTKVNQTLPGGVDLVAAGHTHQTHNNLVGDVHVIQDGCNAKEFGRVDLYVDPTTHKVIPSKTNSWAGLSVTPDKCDSAHAGFACEQLTLPVAKLPSIDALVTAANQNVAVLGKKKLATAQEVVSVKRIGESALGNVLADALRKAAHSQIAFMNAGGIRTSLQKGDVLYENLFEVLPFNNMAVVMDALPWKVLKGALEQTILTAGSYGTLNESGLKIVYASSDEDSNTQLFKNSELQHVELLDGTLLFDSDTDFSVSDDTTFSVATLDFLATGGGGYHLGGAPITRTLGIARDAIADGFTASTPEMVIHGDVDGRFKNTAAVAEPAVTTPAIAAPATSSP